MKDLSPSWTGPESTVAQPPEPMMETQMMDRCRMVRRPFERALEGRKEWRTSYFGPPGVLRAVSVDRTSGEETKKVIEKEIILVYCCAKG